MFGNQIPPLVSPVLYLSELYLFFFSLSLLFVYVSHHKVAIKNPYNLMFWILSIICAFKNLFK